MPRFRTLILTSLAVLVLGGCKKPAEATLRVSEQKPVTVKTVQVQPIEYPRTHEVVGTVEAKLRAVIEAKTSGRIEELPVRLGQAVKAGDLLVQLDAREVTARLDQASATREQAETDLKRLTALLEQQALTRAEFDAAQARFRVADAALRETETMLTYVKVLAPFDGLVVRKLADRGDLAVPGKALLEIEDPSALRFVANVPEAMVGGLREGTALSVSVGGQSLKAKVSEIAPAGDPVSRTFRVELDLGTSNVRPGTFGRLLLPAGTESLVVVPKGAVITRGQLDIVFVVSTNRAELRLVRTGKQLPEGTEILSGLSGAERIVVENAGMLRDGQPVSSQ